MPVAVERWFGLVGAMDQMGGAQASMLGRRDGVRSDMKWEVEEVREVGLVMSEAKDGGYEGKRGGELVLRF